MNYNPPIDSAANVPLYFYFSKLEASPKERTASTTPANWLIRILMCWDGDGREMTFVEETIDTR